MSGMLNLPCSWSHGYNARFVGVGGGSRLGGRLHVGGGFLGMLLSARGTARSMGLFIDAQERVFATGSLISLVLS